MFTDKFHQLNNTLNLCFLLINSANCCLGIVLDYLGGVILFLAMVISITAALYWNVTSAFVGLAMTYTLLVPVYLNWLVRNLSSVEMNMNSVERIYKYLQLNVEDSCLGKLKESDKRKWNVPRMYVWNVLLICDSVDSCERPVAIGRIHSLQQCFHSIRKLLRANHSQCNLPRRKWTKGIMFCKEF